MVKHINYIKEYKCCGCGLSFYRHKCKVRGDVVFCSITCRNKNYKKVNPDWHPSNYIGENKFIVKPCKECGIDFKSEISVNRFFCSKKCSGISNGKARLGVTKHNDETKKKLSQKQKQHCLKHGNQFVTGKSKGLHSRESIERMSASNSGREPRWKGRTFEYSGVKFRSSYELFYAKHLDSIGVKWEYEPAFKLKNGKTFSPDFKLEDGTIIEVKGYWAQTGKEKWDMFCEEYVELHKQVIMKDDLVKLGMNLKKED